MAIVLFLFGLAAFWFEKMNGTMLVTVAVISIALVVFKNAVLKDVIYKLLKLK